MKNKHTCPICKEKFQDEEQLLKHKKCSLNKKQRASILKGYLLENENKML